MADETQHAATISKNFGITVAFLIPGFMALWPFQYYSPTVGLWFTGVTAVDTAGGGPSTGGFLLAGIAALAVGMLISAIRWATVDQFLHLTGLRRPSLNYAGLRTHIGAYEYLIENQYRYYQYYSNSGVALVVLSAGEIVQRGADGAELFVWITITLLVEAVLITAARDALGKHYDKTRQLLGEAPAEAS